MCGSTRAPALVFQGSSPLPVPNVCRLGLPRRLELRPDLIQAPHWPRLCSPWSILRTLRCSGMRWYPGSFGGCMFGTVRTIAMSVMPRERRENSGLNSSVPSSIAKHLRRPKPRLLQRTRGHPKSETNKPQRHSSLIATSRLYAFPTSVCRGRRWHGT